MVDGEGMGVEERMLQGASQINKVSREGEDCRPPFDFALYV